MTEPWDVPANLFVRFRALGGRLYVDDEAMRFRPHALDRRTGGKEFVVLLRDIDSIGVVRRYWFMPRKQLEVQTRDNRSALFLVNRVSDVQQHLAAAARSAGGDPSLT